MEMVRSNAFSYSLLLCTVSTISPDICHLGELRYFAGIPS